MAFLFSRSLDLKIEMHKLSHIIIRLVYWDRVLLYNSQFVCFIRFMCVLMVPLSLFLSLTQFPSVNLGGISYSSSVSSGAFVFSALLPQSSITLSSTHSIYGYVIHIQFETEKRKEIKKPNTNFPVIAEGAVPYTVCITHSAYPKDDFSKRRLGVRLKKDKCSEWNGSLNIFHITIN